MNEHQFLERITVNPKIFGGKPIIRGRRLAVEHILGMLAAGDTIETLLEAYSWLEKEDVQACLIYAHRLIWTGDWSNNFRFWILDSTNPPQSKI
ncbi:DUF433 domain-containing protein [Chroococcidiopsis sp. CCMEE 29]|uniref:DUF433 domain-containing protein n=1 Tax=Chroococcidiopsis sp. CCMEE 29 TaxID=155894 RepID=UPI0031F95CA5